MSDGRPASTHEADDERSRAADHREPHHPRGAGIVEGVVEVTGVEVLQDCAGDERNRRSQGRAGRTARPPAKANANGRKPAARRACEIETRSERSVKSSGTSMNVNTASDPPTANAAQRRRAANAASGMSRSAATATGPLLVKTSERGCSSSPSGCRAAPGTARTRARPRPGRERPTGCRRRSGATRPGRTQRARQATPARRSRAADPVSSRALERAGTRRTGSTGRSHTSDGPRRAPPAAAVEAKSPRVGVQRAQRQCECSRHQELSR